MVVLNFVQKDKKNLKCKLIKFGMRSVYTQKTYVFNLNFTTGTGFHKYFKKEKRKLKHLTSTA